MIILGWPSNTSTQHILLIITMIWTESKLRPLRNHTFYNDLIQKNQSRCLLFTRSINSSRSLPFLVNNVAASSYGLCLSSHFISYWITLFWQEHGGCRSVYCHGVINFGIYKCDVHYIAMSATFMRWTCEIFRSKERSYSLSLSQLVSTDYIKEPFMRLSRMKLMNLFWKSYEVQNIIITVPVLIYAAIWNLSKSIKTPSQIPKIRNTFSPSMKGLHMFSDELFYLPILPYAANERHKVSSYASNHGFDLIMEITPLNCHIFTVYLYIERKSLFW